MRYASEAAFRTALEARLKTQESVRVGLSRLRKRVVFERLLARLGQAAPQAWVLKGGFALEMRLGEWARTTKDVDIDWTLEENETVDLLQEAAALELEDLFGFSVERTNADLEDTGGAQRWAVTATLAGRQFERVAMDLGYATTPVLEPETVVSSQLLEFAGLEPVLIPVVAVEQHVAEKLHAYTRIYSSQVPSSRVKDLIDLVVISSTTPLEAARLTHAIGEIFERRATHPVPNAVPVPPTEWQASWRKLVTDLPANDDVFAGHSSAAAFLDPVLCNEVTSGTWDPDAGRWHPG